MKKIYLNIQAVIHLFQLITGLLVSFFSLASQEQLENNIKIHFWKFILIKLEGTFTVCFSLTIFGAFLGCCFLYFNKIERDFLINYKLKEIVYVILFCIIVNLFWVFY